MSCTPGYYSNREGSLNCTACPKGDFCDLFDPGKAPIPCPKGTYQAKLAELFCQGCTLKYYTNREGSLYCTICPKGHWCDENDRGKAQISCPKGTYQDKLGRWYCSTCTLGYYSNREGSLYCTICPKGHWCDEKDQGKAPIPCPKGTYQDKLGRWYCSNCSDGYYSSKTGSFHCKICPKGHWCDKNNKGKVPALYQKGTYQYKAGKSFCYNCPNSYYSDKEGSLYCKFCLRGHWCDKNDKGKPPILCPIGKYQDQIGRHFCWSCPNGTYTKGAAATKCLIVNHYG